MTVAPPMRPPTPIVWPKQQELKEATPVLAVIRTCNCSKVISPGYVDLTGRASPSNDEVRFSYKGKNYKTFVSGKGLYYLFRDAHGELTLTKDTQNHKFPCCETRLHFPMIGL